MDTRYATALRNATNAWAQNRMADAATMQDLKHRGYREQDTTKKVNPVSANESILLEPQLARFGSLGTRLNVFA